MWKMGRSVRLAPAEPSTVQKRSCHTQGVQSNRLNRGGESSKSHNEGDILVRRAQRGRTTEIGAANRTVIDGCVVSYQPVLNLQLRLTHDSDVSAVSSTSSHPHLPGLTIVKIRRFLETGGTVAAGRKERLHRPLGGLARTAPSARGKASATLTVRV